MRSCELIGCSFPVPPVLDSVALRIYVAHELTRKNAMKYAKTYLFALSLSLGACDQSAPTASGADQAQSPTTDQAIVQLYNRSCRSCHASGAGGAPITHRVDAWQIRVDKGMDALLQSTVEGYRGMPPRGMCYDCDEKQFRELIRYMAAGTKGL